MVEDREIHGQTVLERLHELPGGSQLLALAAGRDDVELVGGATRDLLLGRTPRELDVVVGGGAAPFAAELAASLGALAGEAGDERAEASFHERFGTALVSWPEGQIDVATRRTESYSAPGALPDVRAGTPDQDLQRRDFTVNAIAVALAGPRTGELRAVAHALDDLVAARLRVLHDRSFLDDPTRLLRLARYRARLAFEPEAHTSELAAAALAGGALASVSRARIGGELRLALAEADPIAALAAVSRLGILSALDPRLGLDESLVRRALAILPADGRPDLLLLACLVRSLAADGGADSEQAAFGLLDELEFTAGDRDRAVRTARLAPGLTARMAGAETPSQLREAVRGAPLEAIALAGSMEEGQPPGKASEAAHRWLEELRHVHLAITGDDLLSAGVPAGPEVGRRLELALRRKLDGELADGRAAELGAAMEGP